MNQETLEKAQSIGLDVVAVCDWFNVVRPTDGQAPRVLLAGSTEDCEAFLLGYLAHHEHIKRVIEENASKHGSILLDASLLMGVAGTVTTCDDEGNIGLTLVEMCDLMMAKASPLHIGIDYAQPCSEKTVVKLFPFQEKLIQQLMEPTLIKQARANHKPRQFIGRKK